MSNDAKEWVTVKVPKGVRDDARDDPRTYGEVMRDGLDHEQALRPSEEHRAKEIVDAVRDELGDADTPDVSEQLDRIEAAAREATQAAQNAENAINEVTQR